MLPSGSNYEDTNILSGQAQQSGDTEIVQEKHWHSKRMKIEQVTETHEPTSSKYVVEPRPRTEAVEEDVSSVTTRCIWR